jgi:hypothetical protein
MKDVKELRYKDKDVENDVKLVVKVYLSFV